MKVQQLQLSDLVNVRKAGFTEFKTCTTTQLEFEYNVEEVARALSENVSLKPDLHPNESNILNFPDYSKPLPLVGLPHNLKVPTKYFFNHDLQYLVHGNTDKDKRYASSLTKFTAASY